MGKNKNNNNHRKRNGSFLKKYSLPILAGALAPVFGAYNLSSNPLEVKNYNEKGELQRTVFIRNGLQRFSFELIKAFSGYNYASQQWSFDNMKPSIYPIGATALFTYAISDKGLGVANKLNANLPFKI